MYYIKNPKCINEQVEDGVILLNEENGNTIVLNETAAFLYDHITLGSEEAMIKALYSILEDTVDIEVVERDCKECIHRMVEAQVLLEVEDV
ncbi:MAG: PqqD family protein [Lachnospiraceae bacterium]|nr:PqqD family protein [Lachnospiraceae bacterium]